MGPLLRRHDDDAEHGNLVLDAVAPNIADINTFVIGDPAVTRRIIL